MARPPSRRDVLRYTVLSAGALTAARLTGGWTTSAAAAPEAEIAAAAVNGLPVPASWKAQPFSLADVTLNPSLFVEKRDRMLAYARAYPADRILSNFRRTAGLGTLGAQPPGGWDDATGNLRGHYSGHFMSLLAQSYASTGEAIFKTKLDYIVTELQKCQDALASHVGEPGGLPPAPTWAAGTSGGALQLTGDGQYVGLPDATIDGLSDFTIAVWVNLSELRTWSRVFDFGTGATANMFLTVHSGTGPRFAITTTGSANEQRIQGPVPLTTNRWTHLAVTRSGTVGILYVDGVAVASNTAMTLSPADVGAPKNNWLGRSQYGDAMLAGLLDSFHLFDRGLSAAEVSALATLSSSAPTGNLARYEFDETSGFIVEDSSGRDWDASVVTGTGTSPGPSFPGYLAAYPETQFIQLEELMTYPAIWAPYYTCHKIMRGLLDAHGLTGNATALTIASGMGNWAHSRLSKLTPDHRQRMWALYIAGEYGGMNEVMADLYALTGTQGYLDTAGYFDNTSLLDACVADNDILNGKHANQHIPQFLGYLRMYEQGRPASYLEAARNFYGMVVPHRTYMHGGIGQGELFRARDRIAGSIVSNTNAETCACYNMLKVTRNLFFHEPDAKLMDYYEKGLVNQILASRQDVNSNTDPLVNYFVPVGAGSVRSYGNTGTCCGGTGLENHTKYQDSIYFRTPDSSTLYVNLYISSVLNWPERGLVVTQTSDYPREDTSTLTFEGSGALSLRLRVPSWATTGVQILLNGVVHAVAAKPGTYATITRRWRSGDRVDVRFPFRLHVERAIDDPSLQALMYGPVSLVARSSETNWHQLSLYRGMDLSGSLTHAVVPAGTPMEFTSHGLTFVPFYLGDTARYHAYFRRNEPTIVFGTTDTGVPNSAGPDMFTFLDRIWEAAPFSNGPVIMQRVSEFAEKWVALGLLTRGQSKTVVEAARKAF